MKSSLTISRYWHHPQIHTKVTTQEIGLAMDLDDFIEALLHDLGPVRRCERLKTFRARVKKTVEDVLEKVKEESAKVPPPPALEHPA